MIRSFRVDISALDCGDAMHDTDTILLICGDDIDAGPLMAGLHRAQMGVVGPIQTARMALALTAQTPPTLALLAGEPTGERKAPELAQALMNTWGVRSMLLDPHAHETHRAADWRAPDHQVARVRSALGREPIQG